MGGAQVYYICCLEPRTRLTHSFSCRCCAQIVVSGIGAAAAASKSESTAVVRRPAAAKGQILANPCSNVVLKTKSSLCERTSAGSGSTKMQSIDDGQRRGGSASRDDRSPPPPHTASAASAEWITVRRLSTKPKKKIGSVGASRMYHVPSFCNVLREEHEEASSSSRTSSSRAANEEEEASSSEATKSRGSGSIENVSGSTIRTEIISNSISGTEVPPDRSSWGGMWRIIALLIVLLRCDDVTCSPTSVPTSGPTMSRAGVCDDPSSFLDSGTYSTGCYYSITTSNNNKNFSKFFSCPAACTSSTCPLNATASCTYKTPSVFDSTLSDYYYCNCPAKNESECYSYSVGGEFMPTPNPTPKVASDTTLALNSLAEQYQRWAQIVTGPIPRGVARKS